MEITRDIFLLELNNLISLINYYELEYKLLGVQTDEIESHNRNLIIEVTNHLRSISVNKRKFNYNSLIISLYGSLEKFIENTIIEYADNLNNLFTHYDKLPKKIIDNHTELSFDFLKKVKGPRYTGMVTIKEIITNLNSCINLNENYNLNKDAFAQHTSNYRIGIIANNFQYLGIENLPHLLKKNKFFDDYINEKYEPSEKNGLTETEIFSFIEDLASRRNEVAHGVSNEILSNSIVLEYVNFFKIFACALIDCLRMNYHILEAEEKGILLGRPIDVYRSGEIIVIENNFIEIKNGDSIIGISDTSVIKTKIKSMQLYGESIFLIGNTISEEIGFVIDNKLTKNHQLYIIK